jgi:SpoIID/LytB domain protein
MAQVPIRRRTWRPNSTPVAVIVGAAMTAMTIIGAVLPVGPSAIEAASAAGAGPLTAIAVTGHGFGHGRGMGQYGALGYAVDLGYNYHQILDHYYGTTTAGQVPASQTITVDLTSHDGQDTVVTSSQGALSTNPPTGLHCVGGTACAVRVTRTGSGTFRVYEGSACNGGPGGWVVVAPTVHATSVAVVPTLAPSDDPGTMLQLCEASDVRWLRGSLIAQDTGTGQATVNRLPLESYLRGVVPRESPAFWGTLGHGAGEQALDAQAVAARSYAMAENRFPYAKTCDTTSCQVYGGRAVQTNGGTFTDQEGTAAYATSDQAVAATAGQVRLLGNGQVARTEFSSSTGGYSAGGAFPAVLDAGDATASNPNHTWMVQLSAAAITNAFGAGKGALEAVSVVQRNGLGDFGGRVTTLSLQFDRGTATVSGAAFAAALGLKSDWFDVTNSVALAYHALTASGGVYSFGGAPSYGSLTASQAAGGAVGLAEGHGGYWILTANGVVYPFGSVPSYGSVANLHLNQPARQIVATPSGLGYWIIAGDGGVFSYGDAHFYGSTGGKRLNAPIVGVASTATGGGYWLLGSDGGIFSFGDAHFYGSTGGIHLNAPVNAIAALSNGRGYWLAAGDGGIFTFGGAVFAGSLPQLGVTAPAVGMRASPSNQGYLIATGAGHLYGFGDAGTAGGPGDLGVRSPTVAIDLAR